MLHATNITQSGGSTAKAIYKCLGKNIDVRSQIETIEDAANLGLVESNDVDIIFSSFPSEAVGTLFDPSHKGRMLAMFRDPVDREFYALSISFIFCAHLVCCIILLTQFPSSSILPYQFQD